MDGSSASTVAEGSGLEAQGCAGVKSRFSRRQSIVDVPGELLPTRLLPVDALDDVREDILSAFLTLAHAVNGSEGKCCVCLGASEAATVSFLEFHCKCHEAFIACLVRSGKDWLKQVDFIDLYWPAGGLWDPEQFRLLMYCALVEKGLDGRLKVAYNMTALSYVAFLAK